MRNILKNETQVIDCLSYGATWKVTHDMGLTDKAVFNGICGL